VWSTDRSGTAGALVGPAVRDGVVARPGLFGLLRGAGRVTVVPAPAGSGKTLLLRSWIGAAGPGGARRVGAGQGEERDPQRLWLSVLGALQRAAAGSKLVRPLTAEMGP
jgi:LuxR family transcriptional regulator, maltose regulon positive regulatory protein